MARCGVLTQTPEPAWQAYFSSRERKSAANEEDVGERKEGEQLRTVLLDAAVAHLAIAELAFDDAEDVLDLGAHLADTAIASTLTLREFTSRLSLFLHGPEHARAFRRAASRPLPRGVRPRPQRSPSSARGARADGGN